MSWASHAKALALITGIVAMALLHHGHVQAFIADVYESLRRRLPKPLRKREVLLQPSLFQVHFDDPAVHYEVCVQRKTRSIEIGLHFEGAREDNQRWADVLAGRAAEVQAKLGPGAELEEWTRAWTRLHESHPVAGAEWRPKVSLTPELVEETAERIARYIEVLEPILRKEKGAKRGRPSPQAGAPRRGAGGGTASRSAAPRRRARSRRA